MLRPRVKQLRPRASSARTSVRAEEPLECNCNGDRPDEQEARAQEVRSFVPRVPCAGLFGAAAGLSVAVYRAPEQEALPHEE